MSRHIDLPDLELQDPDYYTDVDDQEESDQRVILGGALILATGMAFHQVISRQPLFSEGLNPVSSVLLLLITFGLMIYGAFIIGHRLPMFIGQLGSGKRAMTDSECAAFSALIKIADHVDNEELAERIRDYLDTMENRDHVPRIIDLKELGAYLKTHMSEADWASASPYLVTIDPKHLRYL